MTRSHPFDDLILYTHTHTVHTYKVWLEKKTFDGIYDNFILYTRLNLVAAIKRVFNNKVYIFGSYYVIVIGGSFFFLTIFTFGFFKY